MLNLSKITKAILATGSVFLIYGYACRLLNLYFFWESKSIGWAIILIGIINLLRNRIKQKKSSKKKSLVEKIGMGVLIFGLVVKSMLFIIIPNTDAYHLAQDYIKSDQDLIKELGEIESFSLLPSGGIQKTTDSNGTYGSAQIELIVKGSKTYKEVIVFVFKEANKPNWEVQGFN